MSLTLYLLRHGQTELSRADAFCGSGLDPELTMDGQAMAQSFAEAYQRHSWLAVFTSELRRAISTAEPLAQALKMTSEVRADLNEIGYGRWEGFSKEQVDRDYHDDYSNWLADPAWHAPTGGELAVQVAQRALRVIEDINARYDEGSVLVVSHKATIRIVLCSLVGIDVGRFRYRLSCPVGSVSIVEFTSKGPLLRALADRSHLSEAQRSLPGT